MPFAFIIVGTVLVISGVRGTSSDLLGLVKGDLTGLYNNYIYWVVVILIIGSLGYIKPLQKISWAFMALVLVALVLKEGNPSGAGGGFFSTFQSALSKISSGPSA